MNAIVQKIKDIIINSIDYTLPKKGPIEKQGGLVIFDYTKTNPELCDYLKKVSKEILALSSLLESVKGKGFGGGSDFTDFFYIYPDAIELIDDKVANAIHDYLGPDARIDFAALAMLNMDSAAGELINYSGIMHHDSVGHRLKLFFPLNLDGNKDYPTLYIENTHNTKWKTYATPMSKHGTRIPNEILAKYSDLSVLEKVVPFGVGYLFDTNAIHSGCYRSSKQSRMVLQFEFSNKKSFLVRGKVGPSRFSLHKTVCEHLDRLNLLRKKHIKLIDGDECVHEGRCNRRNTLDLRSVMTVE